MLIVSKSQELVHYNYRMLEWQYRVLRHSLARADSDMHIA